LIPLQKVASSRLLSLNLFWQNPFLVKLAPILGLSEESKPSFTVPASSYFHQSLYSWHLPAGIFGPSSLDLHRRLAPG
jgi:hypothetical protein